MFADNRIWLCRKWFCTSTKLGTARDRRHIFHRWLTDSTERVSSKFPFNSISLEHKPFEFVAQANEYGFVAYFKSYYWMTWVTSDFNLWKSKWILIFLMAKQSGCIEIMTCASEMVDMIERQTNRDVAKRATLHKRQGCAKYAGISVAIIWETNSWDINESQNLFLVWFQSLPSCKRSFWWVRSVIKPRPLFV